MSNGFTPGPWTAERKNWRGEPEPHKIYISGDAYEVLDDDDPDEAPCRVATAVAIVEGNPTGMQVATANGRLIAASPCLLDALQLLLSEVEKSGNAEARDFGWPAAVAKARAAIAKATGEAD